MYNNTNSTDIKTVLGTFGVAAVICTFTAYAHMIVKDQKDTDFDQPITARFAKCFANYRFSDHIPIPGPSNDRRTPQTATGHYF